MAESSVSPSSVPKRRPSTAGDLVAGRQRNKSSLFSEGANLQTATSAEKERPLTAPSGGPRRARQGRERLQAAAAPPASASAGHGHAAEAQEKAGRGQPKRERGVSARVVEERLDELRADDDFRTEFLCKVDRILKRRSLREHGGFAWVRKATPRTRKSVLLELRRAYPLHTERKADLVELLRSGGLEANRATQPLLDKDTKAVLTRRANEGRRARELRIRDLVSTCRKHQRDQQLAARANEAIKDLKIMARRERAREARGQMAQTKGWLTALKMHAVIAWVANGLAGIEEEKRRSEAARIITRHVVAVARHRYTLRLDAATRVIDSHFARRIRRWKIKRDAQSTDVLKRFLTDVKSSDVRTKVKLLAYRVAHAHVQLARLQRWWRRRRQEMTACRRVMCRLWEQEVDRRVDAKIDEIWRASNENGYGNHHHHSQTLHQADAGGGGSGQVGTLRWGSVVRVGGGGPGKEFGHAAAMARGKAARQAREDQARGERAAIRQHLLLDPLINPPSDLKVRMCGSYLKQMARRHAGAVEEFEEKARNAARPQRRAAKFGDKKRGLLPVPHAVQPRGQALHAKGMEAAGFAVRPRWRTGALPGEVAALVDAGKEYITGMRWLWEPQTPSRLDDGTLVADSMPTPEDLAARVASRFRYGGSKLAMFFEDECMSTLGTKGISVTRHERFGAPEKLGALQSSEQAGYAPAAAGWIGEAAAAGGMAGGKKRVAPLLTYHYLPLSSSSGRGVADKKGS